MGRNPRVILAAMIAFCPLARAEDIARFPTLTTKAGKTYQNVIVTKKLPDGISIRHGDGGLAKIPFEQLPEDVAKQLGGFDAGKAMEARNAAASAEEAQRAAIDREVANQAKTESKKKGEAKEIAGSRPAIVKVVQALDGAALCHVAWFANGKMGHTKKDSFGRSYTVYDKTIELTRLSDDMHYITGLPGVVDGQQVGVALVEDGTYSYINTMGASATVRKWKCVSTPADASDIRLQRGGQYIPRPPAGWRQSVGGG